MVNGYGTLAAYVGSCIISQNDTLSHPNALKVNLQLRLLLKCHEMSTVQTTRIIHIF